MADSLSTDIGAIARDLSVPADHVQAVVKLLDEGNTPAFITRFRREATGGLNEGRILEIKRRLNLQRSLAERKSIILKSVESQGKLDEPLAAAIRSAAGSKQLEDLYLPFKPKKQSLGQLARQRGLDPLANDIFGGTASDQDLAARATDYVRVDKGLHQVDDVVRGVGHLIAERFADDVEFRTRFRELLWRNGRLTTRKIEAEASGGDPPVEPTPVRGPASGTASGSAPGQIEPPNISTGGGEPDGGTGAVRDVALVDEVALPVAEPTATPDGGPTPETSVPHKESELTGQPRPVPATDEGAKDDNKKRRRKKKARKHDPFTDYADYSEQISKLPPYRTLAINRAERAKQIRVRSKIDDAQYAELVKSLVPSGHAFSEFMERCAQDAVQRLILPSLEREIRRELTESAEHHALKVFGRNLRHLLLKPPVHGRRVVAIDPGFRYACHAAALDEFGKLLGHSAFQVVGNDQRRADGRQKLAQLINDHQVQIIAIGNGSACRATEQLVSDLINGELAGRNLEYVIVNEAGTNAYATSEIGREELPDCEPSVRCAVSIGRRLLDPLSELVKVDPAHLGIGLYQHDIKAKHLAHELDEVVASCVNYVGVDVNLASPALLRHVSGLGPLAARRLYEYRVQHGPFRNRQQFREVAGIGEQTFVQAAGFLRIVDGDNPLDSTMIHPESYETATKILHKAGFEPGDLLLPRTPTTATSHPQEHQAQAGELPAVGADAANRPADDDGMHRRRGQLRDALFQLDRHKLAEELSVTPLVVGDLIHVLLQTGVDPRERLPGAIFRRGIIKLENLEPQMQLQAQVVNVVDFGVFVDIGLGESSLIHISRLSDGFVSDPHLMFAVGDTLNVWVTQIDAARRRVTLTAVRPGSEKPAPRERRRQGFRKPPPVGASSSARPRPERKPFARKPSKGFEAPKRVQKPPRPVTPITKEMVEGKAPMRSFSDLAQFFTHRAEPPKDA